VTIGWAVEATHPVVTRPPDASPRSARPARAGGNGEIATWVAEHYTVTTVGGQTVYDLAG
jgi:hypothetical protein